jgi:hypothetical protein
VALKRAKLSYGTATKALLQPVDQPSKFLRCRRVRTDGKLVLMLSHVIGAQDMQGRCLEAEVRFERGLETIEPQADELSDVPSVPTGCSKSQIQRHRFTIHFEQQQSQQTRADRIAGKILHQCLKQSRCYLEYLLLIQDRLEKLHLSAIDGRWHDGDERLGRAT